MKRALITGVTGQDGSYLAEFLLERDYEVHGLIRRSSSFNTSRISHIFQEPFLEHRKLHLHYADLEDASRMTNLIWSIEPNEIYNLAAQSHVKVSFEIPDYTGLVTGLGSTRILEAIRGLARRTEVRFYQASSSELFGSTPPPQNEMSIFRPRSPYAAAKLYAYWMTVNYREAYQMHASNGILFNHESPRRGETFVTRKIAKAAARIKYGLQKELRLGNLNAIRDWGYAPEFVEAMWLMLQQENPSDYVIATGVPATVREFAHECFSYFDLEYQDFVVQDERYHRPTEVDALIGDTSKANSLLNWKPKTTWKQLAHILCDNEEKVIRDSG